MTTRVLTLVTNLNYKCISINSSLACHAMMLCFTISVDIIMVRAALFFSLARKASLLHEIFNSVVDLSPGKPFF